ncbi:Permease of the drug/metabolite transporter superfamily [Citrifermentans bremense]|uniref:Permease of the drug/metabolite transporter superfamily n=1 Tax=Citrifermentans bremense TaxID=60035 RepID=A0A7R7FSB2_9BACT|nr:Permease of the drug/metabolite transporter superfamily [Citrifermentans bremense]
MLLLAYWFLGDEIRWFRLLGIAVCILGVVIISWPLKRSNPDPDLASKGGGATSLR